MKNCLKIITLLTFMFWAAAPAYAAKHFMPLNPEEHTLINGKKFMGLGGGKDPIRLERERKEFVSLRRKLRALPMRSARKAIKDEPEKTIEAEPNEEAEIITKALTSSDTDLNHFWPVDPQVKSRISSPFGYRTHPVTGKYAFHAGLDIAAPKGTAVIASEKGTVLDTGSHKNLGKYVKIEHADGTLSVYGHLSKITAKTNATLRRGQKLGEVGSTGRSTGNHLDYSLRREGKPIDPLPLLARPDHDTIALND